MAMIFDENGLEIENVTGLRANKGIIGYWIETDGDAYSLLTPFTD